MSVLFRHIRRPRAQTPRPREVEVGLGGESVADRFCRVSMGCHGFGLHQVRAPRLRTDCRPASLASWCGRVSVSTSSHSGGIQWNSDQPRFRPRCPSVRENSGLAGATPASSGGAKARAPFDFDAAKEQAAVVGSDVIAFATGITPEQRGDVVNATLLAQLVAKRRVPEPKTLPDLISWYEHYFDVLSRVGFAIQDRGFAEYVEKSDTFEAHEAILEVAATLLAGAPAALAVVKRTLEALQKMSADSPWITLFHRESQSANTARFQVSLVNADEASPFLVSLVAFGLQATTRSRRCSSSSSTRTR